MKSINNILLQPSALVLCSVMVIGFLNLAHSHEPSDINQTNQVKIKAAMSWQNQSIVEDHQQDAWLMPGILLGNEALPKAKGAAIDDIQLLTRLNLDNGYYLATKVGYHSHGESGELSLENFWLGKYKRFAAGILRLDAGKMSSRVTDLANYHPSQDTFSSTPLLAETFFGGHHQAIGINANWFVTPILFGEPEHNIGFAKIEFGLELWNGNAWPHSSDAGSVSLFSKYHGELYSLTTDFGLWYANGSAQNRQDARYQSDHHNNSNSVTTPNAAFTGDIKTFGVYGQLSQPIFTEHQQTLTWQANWQWIQQQHSGSLTSDNQSATMQQILDGYSLMLGLTLDNKTQQHKVFFQYEILVVNNDFTNATNTFLTEQNLINDGFEPKRSKLAYHWRWNSEFTLRLETMLDETQMQTLENNQQQIVAQQVYALGLIWHHNLL